MNDNDRHNNFALTVNTGRENGFLRCRIAPQNSLHALITATTKMLYNWSEPTETNVCFHVLNAESYTSCTIY